MQSYQTILLLLASVNLFVAISFINKESIFYILKDLILFLLAVVIVYGNKITDKTDLVYRVEKDKNNLIRITF